MEKQKHPDLLRQYMDQTKVVSFKKEILVIVGIVIVAIFVVASFLPRVEAKKNPQEELTKLQKDYTFEEQDDEILEQIINLPK